MELHETLALTTLGVAVAILLWRLGVRNRLTHRMLLAVFATETIALGGLVSVTGYFGGELVFEHGVGTALTADQPTGHTGHTHEDGHEH